MKKLTIIFGVLFFAVGCSSTSYMLPTDNTHHVKPVIYYQGQAIGPSYLLNNSFLAVWGKRHKKTFTMGVYFQNKSARNILFTPKMIKVYGVNDDGTLKQLKTYNSKKYLKKIKRKQNIALALQGLSEVGGSIGAGESNTEGYIYGNDGSVYNYTATTHDPSKQQEYDDKAARKIKRQKLQNQILRQSLKGGLILKTTLYPGTYVSGNVMVKFKKYDHYVLKVRVEGQTHIIKFKMVNQ